MIWRRRLGGTRRARGKGGVRADMAGGRKKSNGGHGGVLELELGTLGLGSRDSGRDGAYSPRTPG